MRRFEINYKNINYIEIGDNLKILKIMVKIINEPVPQPLFSQTLQSKARYQIVSTIEYPGSYTHFKNFVICAPDPNLIIVCTDANLYQSKREKSQSPDSDYQQMIEQGFISSGQYHIQKLLEADLITTEQFDEINDYYFSRFYEIYPTEETPHVIWKPAPTFQFVD